MNTYRTILEELEVVALPLSTTLWSPEWLRYAHWRIRPSAPKTVVQVYTREGKIIPGETVEVYGPAAFWADPIVIELVLDVKDAQFGNSFHEQIMEVAREVERRSGRRLCPSQVGNAKLVAGGFRCELLFASNGPGTNAAATKEFSRRLSLDFHLKGQSRYLASKRDKGRWEVAVVRKETSISLMDGMSYGRASVLEIPSMDNPVKVVGHVNTRTQIHAIDAVVKGMMVLLSDRQFDELKEECGISEDIDLIVPACTVKFDKGIDRMSVHLWSVFETVKSDHATVSIQAAERVPLTPYGLGIMEATFRNAVEEVMEAFSDATGTKVLSLIDRSIREMVADQAISEEQDTLEFSEDYASHLEVLSASRVMLNSYLPLSTDKMLEDTLRPILVNRTKRIRTLGASVVALGCDGMKPYEVVVPRRLARRLGLELGTIVTVYRYPNTGIEMAEAQIVGFTHLDGIFIDPTWWATRFSGDFDGDLIGLLPVSGLIDESKLMMAESPKSKGKGDMDLVQAISRGLYSKYLIPSADVYLTVCAERGLDLSYGRWVVQRAVDCIKHADEFPSLEEAYIRSGLLDPHWRLVCPPDEKGRVMMPIPRPSACTTLIRGRLGLSKRQRPVVYRNLYRSITRKPATGWLVSVESALKDIVYRVLDTDNFFPKDVVLGAESDLRQILISSKEGRQLAIRIANIYKEWYETLGEGRESAYKLLRELREEVSTSPVGGKAMWFLFASLCLRGADSRYADSAIRSASLRMLGFMPTVVEGWKLTDAVMFMHARGYRRTFRIATRK